LGDACRFLDVSQAALRQWADGGFLRVYRTPGGHRRFLRDDLEALTNGSSSSSDACKHGELEGSALRRIRRRLHHETVANQHWYRSVETQGRDRMRLFGRRLLSILAQQPLLRQRRQGALEESYMLGEQYGTEMVDRGVALKETVEAFIFFRNMVLDSAASDSWGRILELADRALLGVTESYQNRPSLGATSANT
jgi:excisionase family DNA binding protein